MHNEIEIIVVCPICGNKFSCTEGEANAIDPPCCTEDCEQEWADQHPWRPDSHYRAQYDWACGYYDSVEIVMWGTKPYTDAELDAAYATYVRDFERTNKAEEEREFAEFERLQKKFAKETKKGNQS